MSASLDQLNEPSRFEVEAAGDIAFNFEWYGLEANGVPFDVTGTMSIEGTDHCFAGTLTLDDDGWDLFSIDSFQAMEGDQCTTEVAGALDGCVDSN